AKKVYGVEIVEAAIADAKKNAALNNLDNLEFEVGNAEDWMATWQEQGIKPDVIMVDPPRKGLTQSLIESAAKMQPKKIVYVSCNPATLVRDIQSFMDLGYNVTQSILPVDQFPQTAHVETVGLITRVEK
ncbi:MAG: methyltransferase domain-containing protein, partial [Lactobacillus sp.]|uniref:class I SAM-dependent RNA methyltransferase n=1 Tax=Lactobacillus sp. TaxID=1591 RepID=UPI0023C89C45